MTTADIIRHLKRNPHLDKIARELSQHMANEQRAREAFWASADEDTRMEWIAGKAVLHSPVKGRHFVVAINLLGIFIPYVQEHGLGQLAHESTVVACGRHDFMPDIAFWRHDRKAELGMEASIFPAPDFVVEILSKSTEKIDRGLKMEAYAEAGVQEYWLVDTANLAVETYYLQGGEFVPGTVFQGGKIPCRVVSGLEVDTRRVFAGID
jgi:Uma2 family endonuclease